MLRKLTAETHNAGLLLASTILLNSSIHIRQLEEEAVLVVVAMAGAEGAQDTCNDDEATRRSWLGHVHTLLRYPNTAVGCGWVVSSSKKYLRHLSGAVDSACSHHGDQPQLLSQPILVCYFVLLLRCARKSLAIELYSKAMARKLDGMVRVCMWSHSRPDPYNILR